jgi:SNF2 family DNA or RNA helicase
MQLTDYHAKYFAHELTKRCPSDSVEKLAASLIDAQVDLNPHQVEAALFAFKSPLSMGAILADEVGLGTTIEAAKEIEGRKDELIDAVEARLKQNITETALFEIEWEVR